MRRAGTSLAAVLIALAAAVPAAATTSATAATTAAATRTAAARTATATAKAPSRAQVARAVTAAKRSRTLWATINICNSKTHANQVGVRGQMPSLGFSAAMSMRITLNDWSASQKKFVAINSPNAVDTVGLGAHSRGLEQGGTIFPFKKGETGRWNATIVFTWKRHGRVVGRAQRRTTAGHHAADFGSPPHYSAAQCRIR